MEREIKFRLRADNKIVGYEKWYPGKTRGDGSREASPNWLYSEDGERWSPSYIFHNRKDPFTSLKDHNGEAIFEGDIVRYGEHPEVHEIIWWPEYASFVTGKYGTITEVWAKQVEVIGNVHENLELLEGNDGT